MRCADTPNPTPWLKFRAPSQRPDADSKLEGDAVLVTYEQAHHNLRHVRGPASTQSCLNCGDQAVHWAYRNTSPVELEGTLRGRPGKVRYSPEPADYDPLCVMCHRIRDRQIAIDVWDWRVHTEDEVHAQMLEDFRVELEDLRDICEEEGLDYDKELEQLTQDYIDKTRHTMNFVRRYRLMFGEP